MSKKEHSLILLWKIKVVFIKLKENRIFTSIFHDVHIHIFTLGFRII